MSRRMHRPGVVLPHPDSPTMPNVSPARDVERDAIHGAHRAAVSAEQPAADREMLRQLRYREQRSADGGSG